MTVDSTDAKLVRALNALVSQDSGKAKALPGISAATPINPSIGIGVNPVAGGTSASTGVGDINLAGPITVTSSDGLFQWYYAKTINITIGGNTYRVPVVE